MTSPPPIPQRAFLFEQLIEQLRLRGFSITPNQVIRIQQLVDLAGGECGPSGWKTLICPVVATSARQQAEFYAIFDAMFPLLVEQQQPLIEGNGQEDPLDRARPEAPAIGRQPAGRSPWLTSALPVAAAILAVTIAIVWFRLAHRPEPQSSPAASTTASGPAIKKPTSPPQPVPNQAPAPAATQIPTRTQLGAPAWVSTATPLPNRTPMPPSNYVPAPPQAPPPLPKDRFYRAPAFVASAFAATLIAAGLWFRGRRQRNAVLARRSGLRPPYRWFVRFDDAPLPWRSSGVLAPVAQALRTRRHGAIVQFDAAATIRETIRTIGHPQLQFKRLTEMPEYLVLIDRASPKDHQAELYSRLVAELTEEGVETTKFYFDGDPRECWHPSTSRSVELEQLASNADSTRLIIIGDGAGLVDPVSGRLCEWAQTMLDDWPERAILTPVPVSSWGATERELARRLTVLPANEQGLVGMAEYFTFRKDPADGRESRNRPSAVNWRGSDDAVIQEVKEELGTEAFLWLCACAVYPELHWDLTLLFATLPSMPPRLLSEENLIKLVRLPWFRTGVIPDELRVHLVSQLSETQLRQTRGAIISVLERCQPPAGSFAEESRSLFIAQQRHLAEPTRETFKRLRSLSRTVPEEETGRDYVSLHTARTNKLDFLKFALPDNILGVFGQARPNPLKNTTGERREPQVGWHRNPWVLASAACAVAIIVLLLAVRFAVRGPAAPDLDIRRANVLPIRTIPSGADILIDGTYHCYAPCEASVSPGDHRIQAVLQGFDPVHVVGTLVEGSRPKEVVITFLERPLMRIRSLRAPSANAGTEAVTVELDGKWLNKNWLVTGPVPIGLHTLRVFTDQESAVFSTSFEQGRPFQIAGPISSDNALALLMYHSGSSGQLLIQSTVPFLRVQLDNRAMDEIQPGGNLYEGVIPGNHDVTIDDRVKQQRYNFLWATGPSLDAQLVPISNVGHLTVATNLEDGEMTVFLNGHPQKASARGGQVRLLLLPGRYGVQLAKDGYDRVIDQDAVVRASEDTRIAIRLPKSQSPRVDSASLNQGAAAMCSSFSGLKSKFPFRQVGPEVSLSELNAFFQPRTGQLWQFYQQFGKQLVTCSQSGCVPVSNPPMPVNPSFASAFGNLVKFSKALYGENGTEPVYRYRLLPSSEVYDRFKITVNGDGSTVASGGVSKVYEWPGRGAPSFSLEIVQRGNQSGEVVQGFSTLWSVFRFLSNAERTDGVNFTFLKRSGLDNQPVMLDDNGVRRMASYNIRFNAEGAPPVFSKDFLTSLHCLAQVTASR